MGGKFRHGLLEKLLTNVQVPELGPGRLLTLSAPSKELMDHSTSMPGRLQLKRNLLVAFGVCLSSCFSALVAVKDKARKLSGVIRADRKFE